MNHIDPNRIPYVSSFPCSSTAASTSPSIWDVIARVKEYNSVACHVFELGHWEQLFEATIYCLRETIS